MRSWLLLVYKVPREPTSSRVYVWRKLKRLGALALQDAVWVLPATPQTREQLQWLAGEIDELQGEATLWESRILLAGRDESLVQQFTRQAGAAYRKILTQLKRSKPDLDDLSRQYQQVQARDYFHSDLGKQVREALMAARGESAS